MEIIKSIKKSIKLKKISQELGIGKGIDPSIEGTMEKKDRSEKALKELFDICQKDPDIDIILKKYKIDFDHYKELYYNLLSAGTGQWSNGHYVAASSLAFVFTLRYILENLNKESPTEIAFSLLDYFEKGKVGPVEN